MDRTASEHQSPDDAVAGAKVELQEAYSYGVAAAKNAFLAPDTSLQVILDRIK